MDLHGDLLVVDSEAHMVRKVELSKVRAASLASGSLSRDDLELCRCPRHFADEDFDDPDVKRYGFCCSCRLL